MTGFNSKRKASLDTLDHMPYQKRESRPEELAPVPVASEFQGRDGRWHQFLNDEHYENTVKDGTWPVRFLYTHPAAPAPAALTAEQILGAVARGWCHPRNKFKVMDPDLAIAIAAEVNAMIAAAPVPAVQSAAKAIADEQSYDTGLWFVATTVSEAHLQAALRRLTAAVEGEAP
jgi:hypothetical protein